MLLVACHISRNMLVNCVLKLTTLFYENQSVKCIPAFLL